MKFALVGDDPVVRPLLSRLAEHPEHSLTMAAFPGELQGELLNRFPSVGIVPGWDELLTADLDAVIVCGPENVIGESARQLAAGGQALVVFPRGDWETELIYELSLMRDDTGVPLVPINRRRLHSVFRNVPETTAESPGEIVHLKCEWEVETEPGTELSPETARDLLLGDAGLLRHLGGDYHQVTAVHSTTPTGGIVMATVTLSGENLPDAVWTLRPAETPSRWRFTITHSTGTMTFQAPGDGWHVAEVGKADTPAAEEGTEILAFIERSLTRPGERPDWTDLTRDFEVLDAVRRSLARRRTIDLHFETTSERSLFKTQMTAIGCGVLMLTLFGVIALLILGSVLDVRTAAEIAADQADTIFYTHEFQAGEAELTQTGLDHWDRVKDARTDPAMTPILIEPTEDEALSEQRGKHLVQRLEQEGIPNADERVEVHSLQGPWLENILKVARVLVFLPLFAFLLLQALLLITRPAQTHRPKDSERSQ